MPKSFKSKLTIEGEMRERESQSPAMTQRMEVRPVSALREADIWQMALRMAYLPISVRPELGFPPPK